MAFWDDWQKNKNPIAWSEGFQHGYKKIPKSSTPSSEELSLAKANKKLVGKEKLDNSMQDTVQKVVKNMVKEGITSGRFDKNKPRDLDKFNQKFMDKPSNKTSLNNVSITTDSNSYTITSRIKRPFPGRKYAHKTIHNDGTVTISYGPTPNPKDATDFGSRASTTKPEFKPKAEPKVKPTVGSAVKEVAKPADGSEAFIKGVARSAKKISNGRNIDPTAEGSLRKMVSSLPNEAPHVNATGVNKPDERDRAFNKPFSEEMSKNHFNETSAEPTSNPNSNSTVKNSVWNKLKNSKVGNWLKNSKVGGYFTDSPLTPRNVALTYKGWTGQANPVAYAVNAYGMGSGGGYMPVGENTVDKLRIQHGKDELSNQGTTVPINPQGTQYLDPELGIVDTQVLEDEDGIRYYRNARTGHFEALDSDAPYKYYNPKKTHFINADGVFSMPTFNDILNGALSMPKSDTPLPVPPMVPPVSADEGEIPPGTVVVGPDTEKPVQPIQPVQPVQPAKSLRRAPKPGVINNTSDIPVVNTPTPTSNVAAPTLSSVVPQAVRHNGGFDDYRRQSVLSALRAAGGISPAEAVQRGIIPWEALNYV